MVVRSTLNFEGAFYIHKFRVGRVKTQKGKLKMKYNLQFFADGEEQPTTDELFERIGAEDPEPAEQEGTVNEVESEQAESTQGSEKATSDDGIDKNAIYADARRWAEAEVRRRIDSENARIAERFKDFKNPETGAAILTSADYWEALDAQERMKARAEIESQGVDLSKIDALIENSPKLREANRLIREIHAREADMQIANDIAEISKIDPSIKSIADIPQEVYDYTMQNKVPLLDAYKVVNFANISAQQTAAIKQGVINQIAGKSHLTPVGGVAKNDDEVEIPAASLAQWREFYPDASDAELRKKYNRTLKTFS